MNALTTIDFNGQPLLTIEQNGIHYTAVKPICENIGLDWHSQRQRIHRDEVLSEGKVMITSPSKGGSQDMLCLPIDYLNGWLFGVDASRVNPEIRDTLIQYKKDCYKVLHDYWHTGQAIHPAAQPIKDYSGEDLQHLKHIYTIPQLATVLNTSEIHALKRMYDSYDNQPMQPSLFASDSIPPHIQAALDQFWQTVSQLDLQQINHSTDPSVLAINLPELYSQANIKLPQRRSMLTALKHSLMPQFKDSNHSVHSNITGNTKKCWVFVMPNDAETSS